MAVRPRKSISPKAGFLSPANQWPALPCPSSYPRQTRAKPEVKVAVPPGCEHLAEGPTLAGAAAVVLCQLLGAHLPDIQARALRARGGARLIPNSCCSE